MDTYGHQSSVGSNGYDNQYKESYNSNAQLKRTSGYPQGYISNNSYNYNSFSESQGMANSIDGSKAQGRNGSLQNSRQYYPTNYLNTEDARGYSSSREQIKSRLPINYTNTQLNRTGDPSRQTYLRPTDSDYYNRY